MKENSPDRADALIGAICFSPVGSDPYATRPIAKKEDQIAVNNALYTATERMSRSASMFATPYIDFSRWP
jgi:hypothetical protein